MIDQISTAVIGGSGFTEFLTAIETFSPATPYGAPSAPITICDVGDHAVAFLPRHGVEHEYAPHRVNYRANLWALRELGARDVFAPFAAGALSSSLSAGDIVLPDQLVDRTWGRADTFHDDFADGAFHAPFADPYDDHLRSRVMRASETTGIDVRDGGTVVVIQGPRFGTRAESQWYASQGWDLVNMTQYPEAVLARELNVGYTGIALVTDSDTGGEAGGRGHASRGLRGLRPTPRPTPSPRDRGDPRVVSRINFAGRYRPNNSPRPHRPGEGGPSWVSYLRPCPVRAETCGPTATRSGR